MSELKPAVYGVMIALCSEMRGETGQADFAPRMVFDNALRSIIEGRMQAAFAPQTISDILRVSTNFFLIMIIALF